MGVTNAVTIDGAGIPPITLVGPGAGGAATASAVVADIADVARGIRAIDKRRMVHNSATPQIEVDPETYEVRADGVHLTCEPATVLPLEAQAATRARSWKGNASRVSRAPGVI